MAIDIRRDAESLLGRPAQSHEIRDVQQTTCCIVGSGPAGLFLSLLLARQGISVVLLEAHPDFKRDFRGDTIHPAILELLDEIGLADRLLATVSHTKLRRFVPPVPTPVPLVFDFGKLRSRFAFMAFMRQADFLEFLAAEAARYPSFRLIMGANARELVEEKGGGPRRPLSGRRWLAGGARPADRRRGRPLLAPAAARAPASAHQDVTAHRRPVVPPGPPDWRPGGVVGGFNMGRGLFMLARTDHWQVGYVLPKGAYQQVHAAGLEAFKRSLASMMPWIGQRLDELHDWQQCSLLAVEADRLPRWYRPGLLLIGDAAHVMSPLGGNGINYAIQDAAAAANALSAPLAAGHVSVRDLAAVQRRR